MPKNSRSKRSSKHASPVLIVSSVSVEKAPPEDIRSHSGSKYVRKIRSCLTRKVIGEVDCYAVADAFCVDSMPLNHAMKKILCAGIRGKGNRAQDIREAIDALKEELKLEEVRAQENADA